LVALALFGLSPLAVRYADALRPHGLGLLLILVVFGLVWKAVESRRWGWFAAAAVSAVLSVQVLYQNAILVLGLCLAGAFVTLRRGSWKHALRVGAIGLAAALSLVPYLGLIRLGRQWSALLRQPPTWESIWGAFFDAVSASGRVLPWIWVLAAGASLLLLFRRDRSHPARTTAQGNRAGVRPSSGAARPASNGGSEPAAPEDGRTPARSNALGRAADAAQFCGPCLISVVLVFLIFLRALGMDVRAWYLLGVLGIAAVAIDTLLLAAPWAMAVRWGRLALAASVAVFTFPAAFQGVAVRQTNMDLVAAAVQQSATKGDLIVASVWHYGIGFRRYYTGPVPWMVLPPVQELRIHRYDLIKEKMMAADQQTVVRPVTEKVAETLKAGGRVWFVGGLPPVPSGHAPELLPPAPAAPSGWAAPPYEEAWAAQVAWLVQTHALRAEFVPLEVSIPVNPYEDIPLLRVEGWRSK
jgi:hypothetical protein